MSCREILTFQLGNYSNYVGAHWWNIQEFNLSYGGEVTNSNEIDPDVLHRCGETLSGEETYTPRLIVCELAANLGSLKQHGELYGTETVSRGEAGQFGVEVVEQPRVEKNPFLEELEGGPSGVQDGSPSDELEVDAVPKSSYRMEELVRYWSDYLVPYLHPRSVFPIHGVPPASERSDSFSALPNGRSAFREGTEPREQWNDRLRYFSEECDNLQAFNLIVDAHDGFAGVAWETITELADEYVSKTKIAHIVVPYCAENNDRADRLCRHINMVLSVDYFSDNLDLFLPLSLNSGFINYNSRVLPGVSYKPHLAYHTSAIIAASIDTLTSPFRLKDRLYRAGDLAGSLNGFGRRLAATSVCLPFPLAEGLADTLSVWADQPHLVPLTPGFKYPALTGSQWVTLRGFSAFDWSSCNTPLSGQGLLHQCASPQDLLEMYVRTAMSKQSEAVTIGDPLSTNHPFPGILSPSQLAVLSSVESSSQCNQFLEPLIDGARSINIRKLPQFVENGLEADEYNETIMRLFDLSDCYKQ